MKTLVPSLIIIAVIIGVTFGTRVLLKKFAPEAEKRETVVEPPVVETAIVRGGDFAIPLTSEGVVESRRDTILSAQVGGRIEWVDPGFEVGARFKADTVIARIDSVDYEAAVAQAESLLAQAKLALVQEQARAGQAARDWKKIGGGKPPTDLVLRVPFLESAAANVKAAKQGVEKAKADLERTAIKAPFDCRVRSVNLNLGATVAPGGILGRIYDPESLLIRLPLTLADYDLIPGDPVISLHTTINGVRREWKGDLLWDLGEVDRQTLSAYVLARVLPREEGGEKFRLPPPGIFLKAGIDGVVLSGVVRVPRAAVRGQGEVFVLGKDNQLEIRTLTVARRGAEVIYASEKIEDGEKVILTRIEVPVPGMKLAEAKPEEGNIQ